jgi:hypothetical protein
MSTAASYTREVETALEAAALARFGTGAAVSVTRHTDWEWNGDRTRVPWYALSVKRHAGAEFEVIGRRRTRGELLGLLEKAS